MQKHKGDIMPKKKKKGFVSGFFGGVSKGFGKAKNAIENFELKQEERDKMKLQKKREKFKREQEKRQMELQRLKTEKKIAKEKQQQKPQDVYNPFVGQSRGSKKKKKNVYDPLGGNGFM